MYVAQRCYKWMGWGWDWVGQPGKGEYKAPYGANKKVWIIIKQRENRNSQGSMKLSKYETESSSGRKESDICRWCSEDECGYSDVSLILVMSDEKRLRLEDNLCLRLRLEDAPLSVPSPPLFYSFGKHTSLEKRILGHPQYPCRALQRNVLDVLCIFKLGFFALVVKLFDFDLWLFRWQQNNRNVSMQVTWLKQGDDICSRKCLNLFPVLT